MGEERINKIKIEDLSQPEEELSPEEAQRIQGGAVSGSDATRTEQSQKSSLTNRQEQDNK